MYKAEKMVLYSKANHPAVLESHFGNLWTNGTYIRDYAGMIVGRFNFEDTGIFYYGEYEGESFQGNLTDRVLCERIPQYFDRYYGKRYTNCATMAHFLTTGEFIECTERENYFVLDQGMRAYSSAGRVDLGDMLCIIYANKRILRSRKFPEFRSKFVKAQKGRYHSGSFASCFPMKNRSFSPEEIRQVFREGLAKSYHFMVCIGHHHGRSVWLSQYGRMAPNSPRVAVVVTLGEYDPYQKYDPLFTLIKKRR